MAQATPAKPPRPITRGQVSALLRAMRGVTTNHSLEGRPSFDSVELVNIEQLVVDAVRVVNEACEVSA